MESLCQCITKSKITPSHQNAKCELKRLNQVLFKTV